MGCASSSNNPLSTTNGGGMDADNCGLSNQPTYPPAEAFVIPLNDEKDNNDGNKNDNDSLIKKHPPKRLQHQIALAEQKEKESVENPPTVNDLEEKLAQAEIRRQTYIQNKIDSIVTISYNKAKGDGDDGDGCGGDGDAGDNVKENEEDDVIINK
ncbi:hypothetical protein ACFFRR_009418 [Megaselia abdita]